MKRLLSFGIIILLCTGCSQQQQLASYAPLLERGAQKQIALSIDIFEDGRENKKDVAVFTLYKIIPVIHHESSPDLLQWITNAFKTELKHSGYQVIDKSPEVKYRLEGKLIKAHAKVDMTINSRFSIELALYNDSILLFRKTYSAKTSKGVTTHDLLAGGVQQILAAFTLDLENYFATQQETL